MHRLWILPVTILLSFSMQTAATFAADVPPGWSDCDREKPIEDGVCVPQANTDGTEILVCTRNAVLPIKNDAELCARGCELRFDVGKKKPRIVNIRSFELTIHGGSGHQFTGMKFNPNMSPNEQQITFDVQKPGPCTGMEKVGVTYTLGLEMERQ